MPSNNRIEEIIEREADRISKKGGIGGISIDVGRSVETLGVIPTGISKLDNLIGGGIPIGGVTELSGRYKAGKSTLALQILSSYQRVNEGKIGVFVDLERKWDPEYASHLGANIDQTYVLRGEKAEAIFDALIRICKEKGAGIVIIDSIASVATAREGEELEKADVASFPSLMTRFTKVVSPYISINEIAIIAVNQVRVNLTQMGAFGERTPGGHSYHHGLYMSLRMKRKAMTIPTKVVISVERARKIGVIEGSSLEMELTTGGLHCVDTEWIDGVFDNIDGIRVLKNDIKINNKKISKLLVSTNIGKEIAVSLLDDGKVGELKEMLLSLVEKGEL